MYEMWQAFEHRESEYGSILCKKCYQTDRDADWIEQYDNCYCDDWNENL